MTMELFINVLVTVTLVELMVANRKAMAITTSIRNVGVGLVIATSSFPGTAAVTATLAFALFQSLVMALVALGWGKLLSPDRLCHGGRGHN